MCVRQAIDLCLLLLGHLTYMSVDLYFTTDSSSFSSSSSFYCLQSLSSVNRTRLCLVTCSQVSALQKRMSKIWGIPSPTNWGQKHLTGRLPNLIATLTAYIYGMKHDIDNGSSALTTTQGLVHRLETTWTLVHKQLQTWPAFYPPYVNLSLIHISEPTRPY